jgi:colanic acid/amylovoran biosynthesis glycosyltransferase
MKVIFCIHDGENIINGVNAWLLRLLPQLKYNGITVQVIATTWADEQRCTTIPILKEHGITCAIINPKKRYVQREVRWILEYVNKELPDVVVVNDMFQAWYASKWIQKMGIPVIGVLHNDNIESEARIKEFTTGKNSGHIKAVVAVSGILFKKAREIQSGVIVKNIPCGVPVLISKTNYDPKNTFRIAYIGRLAQEQKNIANVVKAFCEVAALQHDVEALIYGSGPDAELVKDILKAHGNPKNVILKGHIHPNKIQEELLHIHAIVLMSDYEGLPVSIMEAMAAGVVPISTRIKSGVPELLIENITGLYVDEPGQLKDKIKYLQGNPNVWHQLSSNAKAHIERKFSSQITDQLWLDLLNEVRPVEKKKIKIPAKIILPPVNKNISLGDNREPSLFIKAIRRIIRELTK